MAPTRISQLCGRGRAAIALKHTRLLGAGDPEVIAEVAGWTDVVLVTNDDNMPSEHGSLLTRSGLTRAVVAPRSDSAFTLQAWERETRKVPRRSAEQTEFPLKPQR